MGLPFFIGEKYMRKDFDFKSSVENICDDVKNMLIEKNKAYGNSALDPVRIFSKVDSTEQINVRIDDKLSRLSKGNEYPEEDTINDLIGYLILLKISKEYNAK